MHIMNTSSSVGVFLRKDTMKVLILLSVVAVAFASEQCRGKNEHYNSCGTSCPLTCNNYRDAPLMCNKMCNPACECDHGYVRTDDWRCVKPEECPARAQQCGENEHYNQCGTACPLTCDNYQDPPLVCNRMCVPGCHCDKGYVRSSDGRCVRPQECLATAEPLVKTCLAKPDPGMCRAYFPMWYYDVQTGKCHQFVYGGCQGNGNRYVSEEECLEHCGDFRTKQSSANLCELPAVTGPCRALIPRFYFDKQTGKCQRFIYGGCGGNENNFVNEEDCHQICGAQSAVGVCSLEAEVGPCRGYFERYHFNQKTGRCQKFIYGGCGGNENNFERLEDCKNTCA